MLAGFTLGRLIGKSLAMPDIRLGGHRPAPDAATEPEVDRPRAAAEPSRAFAEPRPQPPPAARPLVRHGPAGHIALAAEPAPDPEDPAFGRLFDRFGDARVVLLGASTHGTSEFYRARAAITRWLVENRGFNIIALDADWPDGRALDARVRGQRGSAEPPTAPAFPAWLWRNAEFDAFLGWLATHNRDRRPGAQAGICGLDRYGLAASMQAAVEHLERADPEAAALARERYGCIDPWAGDSQAYERMAASGRYAACEGAVTDLLSERLSRQLREAVGGDQAVVNATENARLIREAEDHYRVLYYGGAEAWNRRNAHMFETLRTVLEAGGRDAKAVVWAHNAHVGDARATEMGAVRDGLSLGQLCRQAWPDEARLIGFGTGGGTVACARAWGGAMEIRPLGPCSPESVERLSHSAGLDRSLLDLRTHVHSTTRRALSDARPQQFVGAVYSPETAPETHHAQCRLPDQFDAWVWFDRTTAVTA